MQRLGVALIPHRDITMAEYIQIAQLAERQGHESLWAGESNGLELFTFLGALLSYTTRLKVAPGIASIFTRTPALMAMSTASLHLIAPQRVVLGLGVSTRIIVGDWHGLEWDHPLARMAEYVPMLRQGLRGERLMYQGQYYHTQHFRLGVESPGVEALGIIGPAEICATKIQQFVAAGVHLPIIIPFTPEATVATGYLRTIGALSASVS